MKRIVLIGNHRMARETLKILASHAGLSTPLVLHRDPERDWRRTLKRIGPENAPRLVQYRNINDEAVLGEIRGAEPDLLFSVDNFDILRKSMLRIPRDGVINFHNGPLPQYRGVNIPSWAILNAETEHGVTWHWVDEGVDTGRVIRQARFPLEPRETAISLIFKCIEKGLELLPDLIDDYVHARLSSSRQTGQGRVYRRSDTPNRGRLDLTADFETLDRIVRALTFHPFENTFVAPHIRTDSGSIVIGTIARREGTRSRDNGQIIEIADDTVVAACRDAIVVFNYLSDENGQTLTTADLSGRFGLVPGALIQAA